MRENKQTAALLSENKRLKKQIELLESLNNAKDSLETAKHGTTFICEDMMQTPEQTNQALVQKLIVLSAKNKELRESCARLEAVASSVMSEYTQLIHSSVNC